MQLSQRDVCCQNACGLSNQSIHVDPNVLGVANCLEQQFADDSGHNPCPSSVSSSTMQLLDESNVRQRPSGKLVRCIRFRSAESSPRMSPRNRLL